jgi:hypothetical protein
MVMVSNGNNVHPKFYLKCEILDMQVRIMVVPQAYFLSLRKKYLCFHFCGIQNIFFVLILKFKMLIWTWFPLFLCLLSISWIKWVHHCRESIQLSLFGNLYIFISKTTHLILVKFVIRVGVGRLYHKFGEFNLSNILGTKIELLSVSSKTVYHSETLYRW